MGLSQMEIASSCGASKRTVNKTLQAAREKGIFWPLDGTMTDNDLDDLLFPKATPHRKWKRSDPKSGIIKL